LVGIICTRTEEQEKEYLEELQVLVATAGETIKSLQKYSIEQGLLVAGLR